MLAIPLGLAAFWIGSSQKRRIAQMPESFLINAKQLQNWLQKWVEANGAIGQLLPEVSQQTRSLSPPNTPPPDVTAYSFDRVVVCDTVAIAQLLIANNFHFENNCAILSLSGYPDAIFDTTMEMLRRNPDLTVFAFHNCSPKGMELTHQLRTDPKWFPEPTIDIIDVGLSPRQVLSMQRMLFVQRLPQSGRMAKTLAPTVRQSLSPEERQWLEAGNFVELESFTPQRLIQILNRSVARGRCIGEAGDVPADDNSWILLSGDDRGFYTSDSFG
ncbi:MAG: MFS transporter permease [Merismopedia sp. SIO2A8]|nr:MFS transporter permease [Merismopedia sp. SIO2A8]